MFTPHMAGEARRLEETLVAHHAEVGALVSVLFLVEDDGVPIRKSETIRHAFTNIIVHFAAAFQIFSRVFGGPRRKAVEVTGWSSDQNRMRGISKGISMTCRVPCILEPVLCSKTTEVSQISKFLKLSQTCSDELIQLIDTPRVPRPTSSSPSKWQATIRTTSGCTPSSTVPRGKSPKWAK